MYQFFLSLISLCFIRNSLFNKHFVRIQLLHLFSSFSPANFQLLRSSDLCSISGIKRLVFPFAHMSHHQPGLKFIQTVLSGKDGRVPAIAGFIVVGQDGTT